MAEAGRRRLNKSLFQIVSLLFLVHIGQSLVFGDYRLRNEFVKGWKEIKTLIIQLTEVQSGTKSVLTLLEEAKSAVNKNRLEIFHQYLQEAVDKVNRQKVKKLSDVTLEMQQLRKILDDPEKSQASHSLVRRLIKAREERLEVYRIYLDLKKDAFNGNLEDTDRELTYTLNKIKYWKKIYYLFEILPILFFCALALYWTGSCICSCIF